MISSWAALIFRIFWLNFVPRALPGTQYCLLTLLSKLTFIRQLSLISFYLCFMCLTCQLFLFVTHFQPCFKRCYRNKSYGNHDNNIMIIIIVIILWWKRRSIICFCFTCQWNKTSPSSRHTIWSVSTSCKCWVSLFLRLSVSSQKSAGEVTLKDCLRLFTKEDVLDGDERPVRSTWRSMFSFHKDVPLTAFPASHRRLPPSRRRATDAKPEGNAPKGSAFRSSLRSSCFVSFSSGLCSACVFGDVCMLPANAQAKVSCLMFQKHVDGFWWGSRFPAHWKSLSYVCLMNIKGLFNLQLIISNT